MLRRSTRARCAAADLPPAVILGTNITGLAEARPLAARGIPVIGVDETMRRFTSWSSAWREVVITTAFNDDALADVLIDIARALPAHRPPALFISTDEQVKVVSRHVDRLREFYRFDFPSRATVDLLMSKEAFASLARERGWPLPPTVAAHTLDQLVERTSTLRFPVVLKPRLKNLASRQFVARKAYRCPDMDAVRAAYAEVAPHEPEVVVQEWIPGTDADVHYAFFYFTSDMVELCSFEGHKIRQWAPETGSTASSEPVNPPVVTALSRTILTETRCSGFCSVEYKRDPRTGTFFITEPTVGRVNLQLGTALANGVDLVSRAYFHVQGLPWPGDAPRTFHRKWVYLDADFRSARHYIATGELTWSSWLKSLRGSREYAVWRLADPGMALGAAGLVVTRGPRALARRLRKFVAG